MRLTNMSTRSKLVTENTGTHTNHMLALMIIQENRTNDKPLHMVITLYVVADVEEREKAKRMKWVVKEVKTDGNDDTNYYLQDIVNMKPFGYAPMFTHRLDDAKKFNSKREAEQYKRENWKAVKVNDIYEGKE